MELPLRQTDSLHTGGGWTLVVSISSKNNDYHQRPAINCWDSELCVPFKKDNMTTRKLSDEHIRHFASCEGKLMPIILYLETSSRRNQTGCGLTEGKNRKHQF